MGQTFADFELIDTPTLSEFLVGYKEDELGRSEIRIPISSVGTGDTGGGAFNFTDNPAVTGVGENTDQNVTVFAEQVQDYGSDNYILSPYFTKVIQGNQNTLVNCIETVFEKTTGSSGLGAIASLATGENNIFVGGTSNEIYGNKNAILSHTSNYNFISGSWNSILGSNSNYLEYDNDFTVLAGGGLNQINFTEFSTLLNSVENTLSGTKYCTIVAGENNILTRGLSGVTLLGVSNRVIRPALSYHTITPNMSVLGDFSSNRIIITSPSGFRHALTVNDSGVLSAVRL